MHLLSGDDGGESESLSQPFLVRLSSPRNEPIGPNTLKPERNTGNGQLLLSTSLTVEIGFSKR